MISVRYFNEERYSPTISRGVIMKISRFVAMCGFAALVAGSSGAAAAETLQKQGPIWSRALPGAVIATPPVTAP